MINIDIQGNEEEKVPLAHRYRLIEPLCAGRLVHDLKATNKTETASPLVPARAKKEHASTSPEILLALDCLGDKSNVEVLLNRISGIRFDSIVVIASRSDRDVLEERYPSCVIKFKFHKCVAERYLSGTLYFDSELVNNSLSILAEGTLPARVKSYLHIYSNSPIPHLRGGIFESQDTLPEFNQPLLIGATKVNGARTLIPSQDSPSKFIDRLLDLEDEILAAAIQKTKLKLEVESLKASGGTGTGSWFDVPKISYPWAKLDDPIAFERSTDPYDARVDDSVLEEAENGRKFLGRFLLESDTPNIPGAVDHLNTLNTERYNYQEEVSVSIVIPVYGQLAYTLNCLDSLFKHRSKYRMEIIVVDDCSPDNSGEILPQVKGIEYIRQPKNGGFINSSNTGGAKANGAYVIMLNNDTRVVAGWLDAILDSFQLFPNAGLVGSKMLYGDGTLQEAGGIIWRDGSAWNYGRNDDPNRPQYTYARQVDYISGCSIALSTTLWNEFGGFDKHFSPAYCEDADLCLRVVAYSKEVWFQPQSRVIHYEGKTSGTDTKTGVKAYQVINTKKLYVRWRDQLLNHRRNAEFPYQERERKVKQRILIVDATAPTPNQDAGSVQTILGLRVFHELGLKSHFVPADNWLYQPGYTDALLREGVDCAYAPYEVGFENYIRRYGWSFDFILVYRVSVLSNLYEMIRLHAPQASLFFHLADLHYLRQMRQAELLGDTLALAEAENLKQIELQLVKLADSTITHSEVEASILTKEVPEANVVVWPLMIEYMGTVQPYSSRRNIVFLGGYRHSPNIDAVLYFVTEIFPHLKNEIPNIHFTIAGAHPPAEIRDLACEDISVTGLVEDLRDVFDTARVFVCPLRVGAGAKGKVMSALSYGLPVVSTEVGVEGAGLIHGAHVLVATDAASFVAETVRLYRSETLWNQMSILGQTHIRENFSTDMGIRIFGEAMKGAVARRLGLTSKDIAASI